MELKLDAKTHYEKLIKDYLESNSSEELANKINNGNKTLKGCWNYITNEARKKATDNCACIEDKEVYGWAVHYFEEDSIKENEIKPIPVKTKTTEKSTPVKEKPILVEGLQQLSLFDVDTTGESNGNGTGENKE